MQTVVADADPEDRRAVAMLPGGGFVILNTEVTPELAAKVKSAIRDHGDAK